MKPKPVTANAAALACHGGPNARAMSPTDMITPPDAMKWRRLKRRRSKRDKRHVDEAADADRADDDARLRRAARALARQDVADVRHDPVKRDALQKHCRIAQHRLRVAKDDPVVRRGGADAEALRRAGGAERSTKACGERAHEPHDGGAEQDRAPAHAPRRSCRTRWSRRSAPAGPWSRTSRSRPAAVRADRNRRSSPCRRARRRPPPARRRSAPRPEVRRSAQALRGTGRPSAPKGSCAGRAPCRRCRQRDPAQAGRARRAGRRRM